MTNNTEEAIIQKDILEQIQSQISIFDNKASILLSVVGIMFALSLSFLDVFHAEFFINQSASYHKWYYVLFSMFILSAMVSIASLVSVIVPRKNNTGKKYPNYYYDIAGMTKEEITTMLFNTTNENKTSDSMLGQILINSRICKKKHIATQIGAFSLIPFVLFISILTIMTMLG